MGVWYCTREEIRAAMESGEVISARNNAQVDRAIEAASRAVEGLLRRRFYPEVATRYFDWPNQSYARSWRLWLGNNDLVSVSSFVSGAATLTAGQYILRNLEDKDEPPYEYVEINLGGTGSFSVSTTHQRSIAITGVWGYSNDEVPAGTVAEVLDATETGVDVSDSSLIGIGDIFRVDTERFIATAKGMITSAQTLQTSNLTASNANQSVNVTTGTGFAIGETILIDSERMLILDISGNVLTVKRGYDGTTLATHTIGATIYVWRTLTATRGTLGTTAATHLTAAPVYRYVVPSLVRTLAIAYTINTLAQEGANYARVAGSGDNQREFTGRGIKEIENDVILRYGRAGRTAAV